MKLYSNLRRISYKGFNNFSVILSLFASARHDLGARFLDIWRCVLGAASIVANDEATYGADFANLMKALYLYSEACEAI